MSEYKLHIKGMTCASCSGRVEKALSSVPGVDSVSVNLATGLARVLGKGHLPLLGLLEAGRRAGFEVEPLLEEERATGLPDQGEENRRLLVSLRVAVILTIPLMVLAMFGPDDLIWRILQGIIATLVLAWPGRDFFTKAWRLLKYRQTAMETLVALGAGAAWLGSCYNLLHGGHLYFESAAMIVTLIITGRILESGARHRAADALRELTDLIPETAVLVDDDGRELEVASTSLQPGDLVRIRSGTKVPTDGVVVQGEGAVDESMLTGESRQVLVGPGDGLTGATILHDGFLEMRVLAVGEQTAIAGIIRMVQDAQGSKAPVQRLADRVASIFVPVVLGIALLTVLLCYLITPQLGLGLILMRAAAVLVIACPCALGLATPTAILVGSGMAAKHGILFRDATSLERLHLIHRLAVDKTGTLTRGKPVVAGFVPMGAGTNDKLFNYIAAAESSVSHPLADALREYCLERSEGSSFALAVVSRPGGGVRAEVAGKQVVIGAAWYLESEGVALDLPIRVVEEMEEKGMSTVLVAVEGRLEAVFGLEDQLRPEAQVLVERLRQLDVNLVLLSGDKENAVRRCAEQVGITRWLSELRPEGKAAQIRNYQDKGEVVAMLGDGVNDAPALAAADVGVALASGTSVAMASASVTLVHGDLARLLDAVRLSRATMRTIRQNLFWAFFYNVCAIPMAALGMLSPMIAAGAMALSSIFVVSNSLRLRTLVKWKS